MSASRSPTAGAYRARTAKVFTPSWRRGFGHSASRSTLVSNAAGAAASDRAARSPRRTCLRRDILATVHAGKHLRAGHRATRRNLRNTDIHGVSAAHHAGQPVGLRGRQPGEDLLRAHDAPPPARRRRRRRRRTTSTVAETNSSRRVRFRVDAVRAAPRAPVPAGVVEARRSLTPRGQVRTLSRERVGSARWSSRHGHRVLTAETEVRTLDGQRWNDEVEHGGLCSALIRRRTRFDTWHLDHSGNGNRCRARRLTPGRWHPGVSRQAPLVTAVLRRRC